MKEEDRTEAVKWDRVLDDLPEDYFTSFPKVTLNPPENTDDYGKNEKSSEDRKAGNG